MNAFLEAEKQKRLARINEVRAKYPEYFVDVDGITFKSIEDFILWYVSFYKLDGTELFRSVRRGSIKQHNKKIAVLCYCLFPELSSVAIGRFLHRDHTTIIYHLGFLKNKRRKIFDVKGTQPPSP